MRAQATRTRDTCFSYDMLGEAARTAEGCRRATSSATWRRSTPSARRPAVRGHACRRADRRGRAMSVKLSALHPRFEPGKEERLDAGAAAAARRAGARRALARASASRSTPRSRTASTSRWTCSPRLHRSARSTAGAGSGLAVQAYGKRAVPVLRWLRRLAERTGKRIPVRLVKGAYWDSEIKWAQERGLADYPVFTRKLHTDVSYLACVRLLLSDPEGVLSAVRHPQRARDRRRARRRRAEPCSSSSACTAWARRSTRRWSATGQLGRPCRIYAPVGAHEDCSPISCAGCWRTAPIPRSSTGWPTRRRRSPRSSAIRSRAVRERAASRRRRV